LDEDIIDPERAFANIAEHTPRIVLAHQPDTAELAPLTSPHASRIDLMCSGHTHGGQVSIPFIGTPLVPSRYGSKYAGGFIQGPAFPVVVSRGIGMSLLPVRFNVPPEIVEITLTRA
jgi:predicted MPP superfamily phosphohydrolase